MYPDLTGHDTDWLFPEPEERFTTNKRAIIQGNSHRNNLQIVNEAIRNAAEIGQDLQVRRI